MNDLEPKGDLAHLSLTELCERLRRRQLSAVELMAAVLERIESNNPALNAIVAQRDREQLMAEAEQAQARLERDEGRPLEGVPLGVKDLEDVGGMVTSHGSLLFADYVAEQDSTQVARLRNAGAIAIAKTNTPEFGFTAISKNQLFGTTRSPWDLQRTPGGSSGGSAAAMAGGLLPLVTASDGGGSIRIPASFTGCFGHKPTYGLVPRGRVKFGAEEHWDYGRTSVYGPLTRTVEDAALFLDQVVGVSDWDPQSLPHPGFSFVERLSEPLPTSLRLGFAPTLGGAVVQSDVAAVVEQAARVFESLGHRLVAVPGGPPDMGPEWGGMGAFEHAGHLHELIHTQEERFTRSWVRGLKRAWQMTPERWGEGARKRAAVNAWTVELFRDVDLLLTPTVPIDPPPARGPFPDEVEGQPFPAVGTAVFTIPFNMTGHPASTVRAGLSAAGLPVGLQIVGPRHRDDLVLQASLAFQRERPWHPQWPTELPA